MSIAQVLQQMQDFGGFVKLAESTHVKWFGESGNIVIGSDFPGGPGQVTVAAQDVVALRDLLNAIHPVAQFEEPEVDTKKRK